ncbi:MAG: dihydroorotase [Cyclobacteriaceae bacterium]|nr:dihydroorotase [Cyclobacteriaceae bacterium]MCH8515831.1 dihydroorotase [Cyclobacteriaceae bacterium]
MKTIIKGANIINENQAFIADVLISGERIEKIANSISVEPGFKVIEAEGRMLIPGAIDDQVHFREPGLTHKGDIASESRAAVAGGITSFMEMPNTVPQSTTKELLEEKYAQAARVSPANYSFYMGGTNDNLDDLLSIDYREVCGIKLFLGSSTGNMLVDDPDVLENIFAKAPALIATHCEDEGMIRANTQKAVDVYGEDIPFEQHPIIRNAEACYLSSSKAIELARKHDARLHVLHISTAIETELFDNSIPLKDKKITAEACVHHLYFTDQDYSRKGSHIKWNPAVKTKTDREAIWKALADGRIDILATDHAPHTLEEKSNKYLNAPSGGPLVQHALPALFSMADRRQLPLALIVEKYCHNPAILFDISERGYIREGYYADLVLLEKTMPYDPADEKNYYKCGWNPFSGEPLDYKVVSSFVNGHMVYDRGSFDMSQRGMRLKFDRKK